MGKGAGGESGIGEGDLGVDWEEWWLRDCWARRAWRFCFLANRPRLALGRFKEDPELAEEEDEVLALLESSVSLDFWMLEEDWWDESLAADLAAIDGLDAEDDASEDDDDSLELSSSNVSTTFLLRTRFLGRGGITWCEGWVGVMEAGGGACQSPGSRGLGGVGRYTANLSSPSKIQSFEMNIQNSKSADTETQSIYPRLDKILDNLSAREGGWLLKPDFAASLP